MANKLAEGLMRFGRQAKQGATFGFADEIQDVLAAVPASVLTDMSYSDALKLARELSREQLSEDWEKAPVTSMAGQVVGGVPLGFTRAGKAATDWIRSGTALSGIGKGAAVGAGFGGAAGLGAADDTLGDRAGGFGLGAGVGAVVGGATAPLARIGSSPDIDYRKVTQKTAKGFDNKAQQELARQLSARPDLPDQLARAEGMNQAAQRTGIQLTLPEMIAQSSSDPLLAQQSVIGSNPMTAGRMAQMYSARSGTPTQQGQIEQQLMRLAQQLDPSVGSYDDAARSLISSADEAQRGITQRLSAQAKPLYERAYQEAIPDDADILQNPLIQNALNRVRNNPVFAQEIGDSAPNSIQALDAVKRSLDDMAESASRQGNRNEARLINQARTQLLESMDAASPSYSQARSVYSGNPDAMQMRQSIGGLADIDPMNVKSVNRALYGGTRQNAEVSAQALGNKAPTAAAARIYDAMDAARGDPVTLAGRIAPDQRTTDMIRTYAGGNQLDETLSVINQAKLGDRMRYGSPTQPRMQAEQGLQSAAGGALNTAVDVKTGGATAILRRAAQMLGRGTQEQDPQFYSDMADLMLTDQGMDLLRRVASGQQAAIQELQQVGLPSLVAGSVNRATTSLPVARAGIGALATPRPESSVFVQPQEDRFSEFDRILQTTPQQAQRFQEFDKILGRK